MRPNNFVTVILGLSNSFWKPLPAPTTIDKLKISQEIHRACRLMGTISTSHRKPCHFHSIPTIVPSPGKTTRLLTNEKLLSSLPLLFSDAQTPTPPPEKSDITTKTEYSSRGVSLLETVWYCCFNNAPIHNPLADRASHCFKMLL